MLKFTLINKAYTGTPVVYSDSEVTSDLKDAVWEMAIKRHDNQNPHIVLVKVEEYVPEKPLFTREEMIKYAMDDLGYEDIKEIEKILETIPGFISGVQEGTQIDLEFNQALFENILKLAADSPDRLRKSDVYRVLDAAKSAGCLKGFVDWLKEQPVPFTVTNEVDKVHADLGATE